MTLDPQSAEAAREVEGTAEHRRQIREAAVASTVGTTLRDHSRSDIDDDASYARAVTTTT